jgi:hypothetical protein
MYFNNIPFSVLTYRQLPVVLCGCETWSFALREEHIPLVLRKIFGTKRDEVTKEKRRRNDEEVYNLYSSTDVIRVIKLRKMKWAGHVSRVGRGADRGLVGKPGIIRNLIIFEEEVGISIKIEVPQTDTNTENGGCMYGEGLLMISA